MGEGVDAGNGALVGEGELTETVDCGVACPWVMLTPATARKTIVKRKICRAASFRLITFSNGNLKAELEKTGRKLAIYGECVARIQAARRKTPELKIRTVSQKPGCG
jgi:hypothetical protein